MPELPEDEQRRARDAAEDYQSTVHAMLAFSAFVVHDASAQRPNSHFGFGRRMTTSKANLVTPSGTVTPDIVAQKSDSYGVVAEVKRSLPSDRTKWSAHIGQIRKYDDDLTGWWTSDGRMAISDTTLLLHQTRSRAFVNVLDDERKKNAEAVGPHTSVVEFNRSDERQVNYFFRLEWGDVRDADLSGRLREGVAVPIDKVIRTFANVKFYDADPPLHSLLALLWIDYFGPLVAAVAYDENLKAFPIDVSSAAIADELQRAYGSQLLEKDERSVEFPSAKVIRRALDALVTMKLAMPLPTGTSEYRVLYRQFNDDILLRFASMLKTPAEKVMEQATLPFDEPQDVITGSVAENPKRKGHASDQTGAAAPSRSRKKSPRK
ncbi:MAG: hypothetical protein QOI58_1496 [Thermoanaerobaculia bacterium]|jgi:hypothetical protein|nr:hypothetical protein [Thermoanaerobaculia bacterium]